MAYPEPSNVREHVVKLRFNEREFDLLRAWSNYSGEQPAVLYRRLLLEAAEIDFVASDGSGEGPQRALFGT